MIKFHLPIIPPKATSQTKRLVMLAGKPRFFPTGDHAAAEGDLLTLCAEHRPEHPMTGPVALHVDFTFPWRKGESQRERGAGMRHNDTRPDLDNMAKLIGDVLTKLQFYGDDGQVADLHLRKFWGDEVGIAVRLEQLTRL